MMRIRWRRSVVDSDEDAKMVCFGMSHFFILPEKVYFGPKWNGVELSRLLS